MTKLYAHYSCGQVVEIKLDHKEEDSVRKMAHYLFATHPHVVAATIVKG